MQKPMSSDDSSSWSIIERNNVTLYNPNYQLVKRAFDLLICLLTLPFTLPFGLFMIYIIRRDSPGPALFIQKRVGRGGKVFNIYKFRTMHHDIDRTKHQEIMKEFVHGQVEQKDQKTFKPVQKGQLTKIGRILRKTSLDELPQLINVFRGEMSLVGPRPNVLWEVDAYFEWHKERLEVLPGITGLAQVKGRSGILFDEIVYWDIEYIRRQSLLFDLKILWWTFEEVIRRKGAQ
ncbi:sugar transferase [Anaerolineales bacterium HSG24]|nr:sugar transferase [Anaerolineales bacterium HSG24]